MDSGMSIRGQGRILFRFRVSRQVHIARSVRSRGGRASSKRLGLRQSTLSKPEAREEARSIDSGALFLGMDRGCVMGTGDGTSN